jgi:hypothetical protein
MYVALYGDWIALHNLNKHTFETKQVTSKNVSFLILCSNASSFV